MRMQITPYSIVPSTHTDTVCPKKKGTVLREKEICITWKFHAQRHFGG